MSEPASTPIAADLRAAVAAHRRIAASIIDALAAPMNDALRLMAGAIPRGGKILLFGNGGSAALAQHLAAELTVRLSGDRPAIAAIALGADGVALTAGGNDLGFSRVFARQIEALGRPGDVAVAISTSGNSDNVCRGLIVARERGLGTIGLGGGDGGAMAAHCMVLLAVPSTATARIQEMHLLLGHVLCGALERALGIVGAADARR
jgi:D-sedoheptulose 7-phosphate isomerase